MSERGPVFPHQKRGALTPEQVRRLKSDLKDGVPLIWLARRVGVRADTLRAAFRKEGQP